MTVTEEIMAVFENIKIGTQFTSTEIKQMVHNRFGRNTSSIIPSDYCYNRLNNGIDFERQPHLFEYTADNLYTYLGIGFPYNGKIYHKPQKGIEICVAEMVNGKIKSELNKPIKHTAETVSTNATLAHKTKREPGLQLRFQVLKRDNFKCCSCGASPAKDPSIELHIDHIIPWSKGGETSIDNLQTLCSKCNIGKSDII